MNTNKQILLPRAPYPNKPQRSSSSHSYVQPQITSNLSTDENEAANATKPRNLISFSPQLALLLSSHLSLQPDQVYHRDGGIRP